MFYKLLFSTFLREKTRSKKIAYLGLLTAINVVFNSFFEFRTFDIQFSFTITISILTGIIVGGFSGFFVCMLADFIGYLLNSFGQLYMPWVGISTGCMALISGIIFIENSKKILLKTAIASLLTFVVCTILINSTGFYLYNMALGFNKSYIGYIDQNFGGNSSYFVYIIYRLIFKGQILNSLANYILLFIILPTLKRVNGVN